MMLKFKQRYNLQLHTYNKYIYVLCSIKIFILILREHIGFITIDYIRIKLNGCQTTTTTTTILFTITLIKLGYMKFKH